MDKRLTPESEVWYSDYHADVFQLMWDNDIVTIPKKEVPVLIQVLEDWVKEKL